MFVGGYISEPVLDGHKSFEAELLPVLGSAESVAVDLRPYSSPIQNQGQVGSCVAHAVVKALEIKRIMKYGREAHIDLSRLAVYYLARELMPIDMTKHDSGTTISHACDVLRRFGVCAESDWPYDPQRVNDAPPWLAMRKAYVRRIKAFYRIKSIGVDRIDSVLAALRAGHPVAFGTQVDDSWFLYRGGILTPPKKLGGGHATVLVGFDGTNFIGENSWGRCWGDEGFYYMSPDVISSLLSNDFWVMVGGWEDYASQLGEGRTS